MFKPFVRRKYMNMCCGCQRIFLSTHGDIDNMLVTYLKIDHDIIKQISQPRKNYIYKIPKQKIIENCKIIKELNVNLENLSYLEHCLNLHPLIVKQRILLLKEMGVRNLALNHIYRFPTTMRRSLKQFKIIHNIPSTENIMQNIINKLGVAVDESILDKFNCNIKTGDYYHLCMKYYKMFHLHLNNDEFYRNKRNTYQSFQELTQLLYIFHTKYFFNYQFLSRHTYLLRQDRNNIESFLSEFENTNVVNDFNIIDLAKKSPRILRISSQRVKEVVLLCKELDISSISTTSYLNILTLSKEVFLERYLSIVNSSELNIWLKHPRILMLIHHYNKVQTRLEYLKLCNRTYTANIHTYLCNDLSFIRYMQGTYSQKSNMKHLIYLLQQEFGKDRANLIHQIKRHKYWRTVPILIVAKTIEYLKKNYSNEDICHNIQIIFYSQSALSRTMNKISEEYTLSKGYKFSSSQYLSLCLYTLEKKYHFNGDAIWQEIDNNPSITAPTNFTDIEDEYENVIETSEIKETVHNVNAIAWLEYLLR